jgi:hypothetical protein
MGRLRFFITVLHGSTIIDTATATPTETFFKKQGPFVKVEHPGLILVPMWHMHPFTLWVHAAANAQSHVTEGHLNVRCPS